MDRLISLTEQHTVSQEEVQVDEGRLVNFMKKKSHLELF